MDNFDKFKEYIKTQNEKELARIVQNYDFIAGSMELKNALSKVLPKDAKIVFSPYIEDPNLVYAVKKFDILDILKREREEKLWIGL